MARESFIKAGLPLSSPFPSVLQTANSFIIMFLQIGVAAGLLAAASAAPHTYIETTTEIVQTTTTCTTTSGVAPVTASATATGSASPFGYYSYNEKPTVNSAAVESVASYAGLPVEQIPGATNAVPPRVSSEVTGITSHGPYTGTPTTTGALSNSPAGTMIPPLPPNPTALRYNPNGELNDQQPIPYTPAGGLGTNGTEPVYRVQSDFDYQSILVGLYQEWIELDLFHNILATFSDEEFAEAGLTAADRYLIQFMAEQETGHATLLSSLLGGPGGATPQVCHYVRYGRTASIKVLTIL